MKIVEPVAWMSPNRERLEFARKDTVYGSHTIPLYTAPPQREWVGLTNPEVAELGYRYFFTSATGKDVEDFAAAIEAKLKERNT